LENLDARKEEEKLVKDIDFMNRKIKQLVHKIEFIDDQITEKENLLEILDDNKDDQMDPEDQAVQNIMEQDEKYQVSEHSNVEEEQEQIDNE